MATPGRAGVLLAASAVLALSGCVVSAQDDADDVGDAVTPSVEASTTAAPEPSSSTAPAPAPAVGGYVVLQTDEVTGAPVTYSPCQPIRYVTHLDGAPDELQRVVVEAVDRVAAATGLRFVDEGATDEEPGPDRDVEVDGYGDGWAPVLIAWTDPATVPDLEGDTAGIGGSVAVTDGGGRSAYVSGDVLLDGPDLAHLLDEPDGDDEVRAVLMHELGHLVGLDHVDDATQLMYPEADPDVVDFGAGDLAGLALMGSGPCVDDLAAP